jgi:hypothetical protein
MFKKNVSISLPENHDDNIMLELAENTEFKDCLRLEKKLSNDKLNFRYLIDSRMGIIYAIFQKEKNNISIEIKEPLSGLFSVIVFFIAGIGFLLFDDDLRVGAFLVGMGFVFFYIRYYNFKEAVVNITTVVKKGLDRIKY